MSKIASSAERSFKQLAACVVANLSALLLLTEVESARFRDEKLLALFDELGQNTSKIGQDVRTYFRCSLFIQQISAIEIFLQEVLRAVLVEHPKKLSGFSFKLNEILDTRSNDELIARAADDLLNKLFYKRPSEYLDELVRLLSIDRSPIEPFWPSFAEAKARRDLGIHNGWLCNEVYLRKLAEVGLTTRHRKGDLLLPVDREYITNTSQCISAIGEAIFSQLIAKHGGREG